MDINKITALRIWRAGLLGLLLPLAVLTCGDTIVTEKTTGTWLVNRDELYIRTVDGGGGFTMDRPRFETASRAAYLIGSERIIGVRIGGSLRAYPRYILRWHEIVNDQIDTEYFSIFYCPFSGAGMAWTREYNGDSTSFGISGLVYNSSHVVFDRATHSIWIPILHECVYGSRIGEPSPDIRFIETSWATWLAMYPESEVISRNNTIYDYNYIDDPYPQYSADDEMLLYPISHYDDRLPRKELVHAVVIDDIARAYRKSTWPEDIYVMNDTFAGQPIVVAGSRSTDLIISFSRRLDDGTVLTFEPASVSLPAIIIDNEGTVWDVFGLAISGPRTGTYLPILESFNCYWFTLASIYPGVEFVEP